MIKPIATLAATTLTMATTAAPPDEGLAFASQLSRAFQHAAETIRPSVVRLATASEYYHRLGGRRGGFTTVVEGTGSGVIISQNGHIITNHHVIADADQIIATLHDGRQVEAVRVGTDPATDLAILQIKEQHLVAADMADPRDAHVGQWVLAVGSPFGLAQSFSAGIISATGRSRIGLSEYEHLIQTDAAINPGNSGGPLIDLHGRIVGINCGITSTTGQGAGVGFAVPVAMVSRVATSIIEDGHATRGYFGVSLRSTPPHHTHAQDSGTSCLITHVVPDSAAHRGGLQRGDLLINIGGHAISTATDARYAIAILQPDTPTAVTVRRNGSTRTLQVTPEAQPDRRPSPH